MTCFQDPASLQGNGEFNPLYSHRLSAYCTRLSPVQRLTSVDEVTPASQRECDLPQTKNSVLIFLLSSCNLKFCGTHVSF